VSTGCKRGCRTLVVITIALLLLAAAGGAWLWQRHADFADRPIVGLPVDASVQVVSGDSFGGVLGKLRQAGVRQGHDLEWRLLARQLDAAGSLKVGEYSLRSGATPRTLLLDMRDGRVISYRFTIVEGWNIRQLRTALNNAAPLLHETSQLDDAALMTLLGHEGQHPEGRFLPETYVYSSGDSDVDVLRRAHEAMQKAVTAAWAGRAASDLPLQSPEEALILASIIEKETGIASERPAIAGVFARRLKLGMRLQTDPTVIYGISGYDGNIRRRDLLTDTPYNTYTRAGLTPTPIAMPGMDALRAAVNPAPGNALYFVAAGDGSGRHVFSVSLAEHNAAVGRYLQQLRRPPQQQAPSP